MPFQLSIPLSAEQSQRIVPALKDLVSCMCGPSKTEQLLDGPILRTITTEWPPVTVDRVQKDPAYLGRLATALGEFGKAIETSGLKDDIIDPDRWPTESRAETWARAMVQLAIERPSPDRLQTWLDRSPGGDRTVGDLRFFDDMRIALKYFLGKLMGHRTLAFVEDDFAWPVLQPDEPDPVGTVMDTCERVTLHLNKDQGPDLFAVMRFKRRLWAMANELVQRGRGTNPPSEPPDGCAISTGRRAVAALRDWLDGLIRDALTQRPVHSLPALTEQFVTLDQAAALVNRSKKTLERYLHRPKSESARMPEPDVEGTGGKPHEWRWEKLRPWLEATFGRPLKNNLPSRSRRPGN
jgi:hypothetical protein